MSCRLKDMSKRLCKRSLIVDNAVCRGQLLQNNTKNHIKSHYLKGIVAAARWIHKNKNKSKNTGRSVVQSGWLAGGLRLRSHTVVVPTVGSTMPQLPYIQKTVIWKACSCSCSIEFEVACESEICWQYLAMLRFKRHACL